MFGGKTCSREADRVVMGTADKNYSRPFGASQKWISNNPQGAQEFAPFLHFPLFV